MSQSPIERCYYYSVPPNDLTEALFVVPTEPGDLSGSVRIVLYITAVDGGTLWRIVQREQAQDALVVHLRIADESVIDDNDPQLLRIYIPVTDQPDLKDRLVHQGWRVVENESNPSEWFVLVPNTPRMVERFLIMFPPDPRGLVWVSRLGRIIRAE